ncbi:MAG: PilT/PilU family type 4a pilus ATPase [Myxococcales bacterium]|nr:PilT/PilU family type 4a pilus ATPase [Myxococcales bacterium]
MSLAAQTKVAAAVADNPQWLQPLGGTQGTQPSPSPLPPGILNPLLYRTLVDGASDLIVSTHREPTMRIVGKLKKVNGVRITQEEFSAVLLEGLPPLKRDEFENKGSVDLSYELENPDSEKPHRFRVNAFRHNEGWSAAFRPIWETIPTLGELNLPGHLTEVTAFPHGLVLVTGPTGSGKSTTLSSLIEHVNQNRFVHIITLEDPIEYLYTSRHSVIHQREVGTHLESFASGLKAALRENPDIILVGEMRDKETVAAALTAAETGHLVLSTLHTANAAQAIDRMVDVFPSHQQSQVRIQLASVLRAVVTQRLLPTQDGAGRIPVVEIVRLNYALANLIREQKTHLFTSQIQTSRGDGMVLFDQSLAEVYQKGWISLEEALRAAHDPKYIKSVLGLA